MLSRTDWDEVMDRVNTEEVSTDIVYFTELSGNVFLTEMADIKPEMIAIWRFNPESFADVFLHTAGYNVTGGKFCFFRFVIRHKSVFVHV
jgi:hypothetical protein